jgi:hypothetical protein
LLTLVHQKVPAALPREGLELVMLLVPIIVCTLDVSNVIVCDLTARAMT